MYSHELIRARLFTIKAVSGSLPAIYLDADRNMFMSCDATLSLSPCELFGFNVGAVVQSILPGEMLSALL